MESACTAANGSRRALLELLSEVNPKSTNRELSVAQITARASPGTERFNVVMRAHDLDAAQQRPAALPAVAPYPSALVKSLAYVGCVEHTVCKTLLLRLLTGDLKFEGFEVRAWIGLAW